MKHLERVIWTLQYCLETLEQCCQCGRCDPCIRGQAEIRQAIGTIEDLLHPAAKSARLSYALRRPSAIAEFSDWPALIQFVRDLLPSDILLSNDAAAAEIAPIAARNNWHFTEYGPGDAGRPSALVQQALDVIHALARTTELNMDDLESETLAMLKQAAQFQNLAALSSFVAGGTPFLSSSLRSPIE